MFYGIIVMMYYFDTDRHHLPHIHVKYGELSIIDGSVIQGNLPSSKMKLVTAWIELHNEELNANWELAINGNQLFTIKPL